MNRVWIITTVVGLFSCIDMAADEPKVPTTVKELFADFDPRTDPLDTRVVREWEKDAVVYRYITFHIGSFKGQPARMAAFFAFPEGAEKRPGLLHLHGGGQRAFLHEVEFYAKRGYACLSINWGGREMEEAKEGDPNTDWGAVDPTQQNVPGYFNLKTGKNYLDPVDSPRNNNWYLLTLGARRGLTFLEQQTEVDPDKLGVYGHSMGGNLTIYVAGTDDRVKAAVPSVGGSGFRTQPWPLLPKQRKQTPNGDVGLYNATIGFESYASLIRAPLLWLGATNDFHGIMDDTYRTGELIPHENVRYAFTPHMNHRFTPEFAVARPLWIDQFLKETFKFPKTPESNLMLTTDDGIPVLRISPDTSLPIDRVQLLYSLDPDPQARFWRTAEATNDESVWTAKLPILSVKQPLFAYANIYYRIPVSPAAPQSEPTDRLAISSMLHTATPDDLRRAETKATDTRSSLIDDFSHGWQDWYKLSANNRHHWEYSTRKLSDPRWQGQSNQKLVLEAQAEYENELVIVLTENFFRSYRGNSQEFVAVIRLRGGKPETLSLLPDAFTATTGQKLSSWKNIDLLSLRAYFEKDGKLFGSKSWKGQQPKVQRLYLQESENR
ncbi:MAG: acetylxylan esterase [Planctomycetaceae bacterium]